MDIKWSSDEAGKFITNVGLITSNGSYGNNIMACEWTHHVSYNPGLIAVSIKPNRATNKNIKESGKFGVNICAHDQNIISSIAGNNSGKNINKIEALKKLGYKFYNAENIKCLMVEGASLNVECKVIKTIELGDHTMFIGEALSTKIGNKKPLIYHNGKYYKLGENIKKPSKNELEGINKIIEKHKR